MNKKLKMTENKIYLNLGCGHNKLNNCINIDCRDKCNPDIVCDIKEIKYEPKTIDGIYATDVLEHIPRNLVISTLRSWYKILKKTGFLVLRLPNIKNIAKKYLNRDIDAKEFSRLIYGNQEENDPANFHKSGFDRKTLTKILKKIGFKRIKEESEYKYNFVFIGCNDNNMLLKFRR